LALGIPALESNTRSRNSSKIPLAPIPYFIRGPHHAEGQFNPNPVKKNRYSFLMEHVDSGNMKFLIGRRSSVYQLFSKRDFTSINVAEIGKK
jgi:hypothetical protein